MLNEVYAPKTVADLAWSRQKSVALSTFVHSIRNDASGGSAAQTPRILLLYGPPGCGKLESLKVLLQEDVTPTTSTVATTANKASASSSPTSTSSFVNVVAENTTATTVNVFHSCEATVGAYAQYLQHVFSLCSGQLVGSTLELMPSSSSASLTTGSSIKNTHSTYSTPANPLHHAHIVKFYGEPATHPLHRCTLLFLRRYEELRTQALREAAQQRRAYGNSLQNPTATPLLDHLRRNLIFFIHTTHDSHNDKLDLNSSFPSAVLQSSAVELFHCTPVTEISLKKRLKQILDCEARRRREVRRATFSCPAEITGGENLFADSSSKALSSPRDTGAAVKGRRKKQKARTAIVPVERTPSFSDVLDQTTLDAIAASSQGDIRQALLQIQWATLVPPEAKQKEQQSAETSGKANGAADVIWARLQKRRALARRTSSTSPTAHEGPGPFQLINCSKREGELNGTSQGGRQAAGASEQDKTPQNGDRKDDTHDEEVILISSSSSSISELSSAPSLSTGLTNEAFSQHGSDSAQDLRAATRKRSRSPQLQLQQHEPTATSDSSPPAAPPRITDMLSLLDSQINNVHSSMMKKIPSVSAHKRGKKEKSQGDVGSAFSAAKPEHRSVLPTTRDEYLGLSHATGRLLTQKYSIDEVLDILNVPPRKILNYMTNNQIRYFSATQLPQCAACAAAASDADALRTSEVFSGGGGVSAAALRERRELADRTTAGENVGNMVRLLDVIALQVFHLTYLARQTDVYVPPGFAAQEPPPFLRSAYPRIREMANFNRVFTNPRWEAVQMEDLNGFSEQEWTQHFLLRLDNPSTAGFVTSPRTTLGSRRRGVGGLGTSFNSDVVTSTATALSPRIQIDEIDVLREGLPDLLSRCGCTETVVLDHYGLAPYIVLNMSPPSSSLLQKQQQQQHVMVEMKAQTRTTPAVKQQAAPTPSFFAAAALSRGTPSTATTPRRTVFKFSSTAASASTASSSDINSAAAPPPPSHGRSPPRPPHGDRPRAACTLLQLKILLRGRDAAKVTLRDDRFVLVATENIATEGAMGDDGGVEERPWIPEGEDIEDD